MLTKTGLAAALVLPMVFAACNRTPEPVPVALPVMSGAEQACADRAAQISGLGPEAVTVVPTASTKTGATIYAASAGGVDYTCVVEIDMSVSTFAPA